MADPIRVLIVDDEERFRETLAKLLGRHGFVVREAGSGPAALELLAQAPCDVIVLDVKMPGMTGLQLLGIHSGETAMIGDRMDTDILAGIESGLDPILVLSGVTTPDEIKQYPYRPRLVLEGVGAIPPA